MPPLDDRTAADHSTWAAESTQASTSPAQPVDLAPGAVIGRYVVLSRLGQGAMGVVYAAHDPQLGRTVAVKILHREADSDEGRARLLREAQALARLTHPNVVAIYDAGTVGERVWLAMEFVAGRTLGAWLKERPRGWPEILEVLVAAGHGLAAAHDKALVHRDFKPENVMITDDGRALVMDFGLAKPDDSAATAPHPALASSRTSSAPSSAKRSARPTPLSATDSPRPADKHDTSSAPSAPSPADDPRPSDVAIASAASFDALSAELTRAGSIVGTPAYMAPEQFLALAIDARADQFSFCVTLWEALHGARPFAAATPSALALHILSGKLRPPPNSSRVPAWLRRALTRGLAPDPAQRFPAMHALLAELARGHARVRRRRILAALALLALLAAALLLALRLDHQRRLHACDLLADELPWRDEHRHAVRDALLATAASHAAATAERVLPGLDVQADRWRTVRRDTCRLADVERTWGPDLRARADECLAEHRDRFEALVDALSHADATAAQMAVGAVARLSPPDACGRAHDLSLRPALPEARRVAVGELRRRLARAAALEITGDYPRGLALAEQALADAETLAWPPLIAEARHRLGKLRIRTAAYAPAEQALAAAYVEAQRAGALEVVADAATALVQVAGRRAHPGEAEVWARAAEVAAVALGDDELRAAQIAGNLASVRASTGDFAGARDLDRRALEIRERLLGQDHPDTAILLNNLANVEQSVGDYRTARTLLERALDVDTRTHGPDHPDVALTLANLALVYFELDDGKQAEALFRRALGIAERALGPDHPTTAGILTNLASVLLGSGDLDPARDLLTRAIAIDERVHGPDHPDVAGGLTNLAAVEGMRGDLDAADRLYLRALEIHTRAGSLDKPDAAGAMIGRGEVLLQRGDLEAAGREYARALPILERSLGPDHEHVARALLGLADVALGESRFADAIPLAERARTITEPLPSPDLWQRARFTLAQALHPAGQRPRARELATAVRDELRAGPDDGFLRSAAVDAWLRAHP